MLHSRLSEINAELLAQICREQWAETQTLDFKAILPKSTDEDRLEFRKDVCALANADGGDIVFGVSEKAGRANALNPISGTTFDAAKRSLLQLLESRIEPAIPGVRFHEVQVEGGFVLVVRVPASFVGPHRFGAPAAERFVMRTDTKTIDLSYAQLRSAFERGSSLLDQARTFRTSRLDQILQRKTVPFLCSGPILAVHIIPLSGLAGRADVDIAGLHNDNRPLMVDRDAMNWRRMTTLDGLVTYLEPDEDGVEHLITMFRNGAFETLRKAAWETPAKAVTGELAGMHLRATINTYAAAAEAFSVNGPALIGVAIANTAGIHLRINQGTYTREPLSDKHVVVPDVLVEDIASPSLDVDTVVRPLMEVLYQAFGAPRCPHFNSHGKWTGAT